MVWLAPAALAGLAAVLLPLAIHLLRRRTAAHIVLPTTRFLVPRTSSTVRLRRISDPILLLVRMAILASAALALAQPVWLGNARLDAWANRTARVVVVDVSESARGSISAEAVAAARSSADPALTVESADLPSALERASRWLAAAPPARREIVVLSDFQRGVLSDADVAAVPREIGLRFVSVGAPNAPAAPAVRTLVPDGVVDGQLSVQDGGTGARYAASDASLDGLRILAPAGDASDVPALMRVVSRAGAFAPDPSQPIVVRFRGGEDLPPVSPVADGWSFQAAQRLLRSIARLDARLEVFSTADALIVDVDAEPASLTAAQVVKAALDARVDPASLRELEPESLSQEKLTAWTREPAPPDPSQWRQADESDGRLFWGLALVLLGVETLLRRSRAVEERESQAHAA